MTTTGLLVAHAKCVRPADQSAWDRWEDDVHLPALCAGDGPWAATRFALTARPQAAGPGLGFTHLTIYELDAADVGAQATGTLDRDDALRAAGRYHAAHATVAADVFVAHGRHAKKPAPDAALRGHILAHVMCTDPAREAEWDAWYDEQHVPDMLACGAFSAMSRWQRLVPRRVGANHLTLYDVATDTVDEAVERAGATLAEIVAAGRKLDVHTGALTLTVRPTGRHGGAGVRRGDR